MNDFFRKFARGMADVVGSSWAFIIAAGAIVLWLLSGPIFHFSDTWQLVVNTTTSIITFLMVFIIQSTQNRDTRTMQLKLDELLRAVQSARTGMVELEDLSDEDLDRLQKEFRRLGREMPEQGSEAFGERKDGGPQPNGTGA